jgi:hypothetical protein
MRRKLNRETAGRARKFRDSRRFAKGGSFISLKSVLSAVKTVKSHCQPPVFS